VAPEAGLEPNPSMPVPPEKLRLKAQATTQLDGVPIFCLGWL
jgi:hypothetical protein